MTTPPDPHSLRERKRRATMVAIENAATTLVVEHGYDAVTVDQICARADISKRTFFNYLPTKEEAVVGVAPETVPDDLREHFLAETGTEVVGTLLQLYLDTFSQARSGDDSHTVALVGRRHAIIRENPELGATRLSAKTRFQHALVELVTEHFDHYPSLRKLDGVPAEDEARATVALVAASVNLGVSAWLGRQNSTFDDLGDDCATALGHMARLVADRAPITPGQRS